MQYLEKSAAQERFKDLPQAMQEKHVTVGKAISDFNEQLLMATAITVQQVKQATTYQDQAKDILKRTGKVVKAIEQSAC